MQITALVLALAAAASAIDIRYYNDNNCGGNAAFWCTNAGPNVCCSSEAVHYPSAGFAAIPGDWKITTRGYINGGWRDLRASEDLYNVNFGCLHREFLSTCFPLSRWTTTLSMSRFEDCADCGV
jgi:hypothetical protein